VTAELPKTEVLLDELHVGAFRGLRDVTLSSLAKVNLLVGGNNSGKTSVLEALGVLASPIGVAEWSLISQGRRGLGVGLSFPDAIRWMFQTADSGSGLHIRLTGKITGSGAAELNASCEAIRGFPPQDRTGSTGSLEEGWRVCALFKSEDPTQPNLSDTFDLWPSSGIAQGELSSVEGIPWVLMDPYSHRNQSDAVYRLSELTKAGARSNVVEMLRGFDPSVTELETLAGRHTNEAYIAVRQQGRELVPASIMGDGFRRALAIALAIPEARGGFLLIDEIETALHVSVLDKLFPWLIRTCDAYNVQLFATTHSLEAVSSMLNSAEGTTDSVATYHLGQKAARYSLEMMRRTVRDRGLDIR
jgi:ABC-type branched-subunit amino acid transport system ATPase component